MPILLKQSSNPLCAYCRSDLSANVYICEGCRAGYHQECSQELGVCGTIGCDKRLDTGLSEDSATPKLKSERRGPDLSPKLDMIKGARLEPATRKKIDPLVYVIVFLVLSYIICYGIIFIL